MFLSIVLIIFGLIILIAGAEALVRGSSSLAKHFGISEIVIGLTIVAFGTSAPELIVNLFSAYRGSADIAIGNIIGSNIANVWLVLGVAAIIFPLTVKENTVWKEIPFALLAVILLFILGNDALFDRVGFNIITRTDGLALIAIFLVFMYYTFGLTKSKGEPESVAKFSKKLSWLMTSTGMLCLFFGGKLLVDNAVSLAHLAGLSETLIGLTIVAIGTSLPELVTSIVAAMRHHEDMAVGNVIGSIIFNVFWILGLTSILIDLPFNILTNVDAIISIGATLLLFIFMFIGKKHKLSRRKGVLFLSLYILYMVYLVIRG